MPWFKVDDQFDANKKVKSIPRRNRAKALGLWVQAGAWSARELTDGFIPDYMIGDFAVTAKIADALVVANLWEKAENGYNFKSWSEFQPTSDEVHAKKSAEAKRKAEWRRARKDRTRKTITSNDEEMSQRDNPGTDAGTPAGLTQSSALPGPTRPDPTYKEKGEKESGTVPDGHRPPPPPIDSLDALANAHAQTLLCDRHQGMDPTDVPPCRACEAKRKAAHAREKRAATQARHNRRALIDACPDCDENGWLLHDGVATRCTHQHERKSA
ncbi:hypothetical protein [Ancrocorticia populi]|uniref:hypothetical protein n=1 Tax=Ancrocorticia populi TaxID=2175228 RepID=UPI003F9EA149